MNLQILNRNLRDYRTPVIIKSRCNRTNLMRRAAQKKPGWQWKGMSWIYGVWWNCCAAR